MDLIEALYHRPKWHRFGATAGCIALSLSCGCGQSPYPLAPVRGTVTIDGQPLGAGKVMFAPIAQGGSAESGRPTFGALESDGSFVLSTHEDGDGAIVGEHWVTIINTGISAAGSPGTISTFSRVAVPRKIEVIAGRENEFAIELTSQEVARFGQRPD